MAIKKQSRNAQRLLTVREFMNLRDGLHRDGGGLWLEIKGASELWHFRYSTTAGKRRQMGLGQALRSDAAIAGQNLTNARKEADEARAKLLAGIDPIDDRRGVKAVEKQAKTIAKERSVVSSLTLARAARAYHEKFVEPHMNTKHAATWIGSLERYLPPEIWHKAISGVQPGELLDALAQLYKTLPETASRIRQRLEAVFADALVRGSVVTNPATVIRHNLRKLPRKKLVHFRSLPYADVPAFFAAAAKQEGSAANALRLLILTAARTSEILGASNKEFDVEAKEWRVPSDRMKGKEEHFVHLTAPALAIVKQQIDDKSNLTEWLFPSPTANDKPLSNMALLVLIRRMKAEKLTTAHGFRSSFSTWGNEVAQARKDVVEACLAHKEEDKVRAAYNRAQFAAERRELLERWAAFLTTNPAGTASEVAEPARAVDEKATSRSPDDPATNACALSPEEVTTVP